ncbi:MAG: peroxiredoxin [Polyangiaceae bacterium]|nr:peroxiredoxin [Polyangiaceae bacterium]
MIAIGSKAPEFNLFNHKRDRVSLEALRGKKVVIAFFPAAFTSVCEKELCTFRDSLAALSELNATVLAVSVDAPFANAAFAQKNSLTFDVLSDYTRDATRAYGIAIDNFAGMPGYTASNRAVFVVNAEGKITYAWVGPNPGVEPDYDEVGRAVAVA